MFSNLKNLNLRNVWTAASSKSIKKVIFPIAVARSCSPICQSSCRAATSVFQTLFQINRGEPEPTLTDEESAASVAKDTDIGHSSSSKPEKFRQDRIQRYLETLLIFVCFALIAGQLPPDVNESHYLTKAKHYWDRDWCAGDIFLGSSFAHWIFYVSTGWLTKLFSLSVVAWIGRCVTWALLAFAWQRLSWKLLPSRGLSVLSAIAFLLLNERFHLAGEWVVGGFEAKGFAYFFILMALGNIIQRRWEFAWLMLGAATAFHVLVGGWGFIAATFAWLAMRWNEADRFQSRLLWFRNSAQKLKTQLLPYCAGAAIGLLGVIPPLLADQASSPATSAAAQFIYVHHRISHHLTFGAFPVWHVARFALIIVFCYLLSCWLKSRYHSIFRRMLPLYFFCIASLSFSFGGLLLSGIAEQNEPLARWSNGLLRFYWFRLADFAIPAATAMSSCLVINSWLSNERRVLTRLSCFVFIGCILAATGLVVVEKFAEPRPRADVQSLPSYENDRRKTIDTYRNWTKVCRWIANNTPANACFITPHQQQTFKWYAGRSEVVCWKDIPQDSETIDQWRQRLRILYDVQRSFAAGLMSYTDEQLKEIASRYGATHLLVPQRAVDLAGTTLKQIYPEDRSEKSTYVVFEF